jgi:hypothetical protein
MYRFSLRTFLIACVALGICTGLLLKWRWQPRVAFSDVRGWTNNGTRYDSKAMMEIAVSGTRTLLNVVVIPERTGYEASSSVNRRVFPDGDGLEIMPRGVFLDGKQIGGHGTSKVVIVLAEKDVRVIELSVSDIAALEAAGPRMIQSRVWKEKVEPQIDRLVRERRNVHDRHALGIPP